MSRRRRPPEYDYICRRCGCACNGRRHLGGGSTAMRACGKPPDPVLRSVFKAEVREDVAAIRERFRRSVT